MLTESQNQRSMTIDQRSTLEIVEIINEEDATIHEVIKKALPAIAEAVDAIVMCINHGGRLLYIGAGTSGRLGILDAAECVPTYSVPPTLVQAIIAGGEKAISEAIEGVEDNIEAGKNDLLALGLSKHDAVVGIAASGRTPYVIGALNAANAIGAMSIAVSCNSPAPILDIAKIKIAAPVGPEVITGSTRMKAGTAQKMILNMLSTATMIKLGKVYGNLMVDVMVTNEKLKRRACGIVTQITGIADEEALRILEQTNNEVKTAIVVALLGVSVVDARQKLAKNQGILRQVID